jgi:hypothetical protein
MLLGFTLAVLIISVSHCLDDHGMFPAVWFSGLYNKIRQHKAFLTLDVHLNIKQGFH